MNETVMETLKKDLQTLQKINEFRREEQQKRKEFYELVHEDVKTEFINGEIIFQSPVKSKHWEACTNISTFLNYYVKKNKLGKVGVEKVMIRCSRNDYEPDIVFFSKEKAANITPDQLLHPPCDLAVEVLSDSTRKIDYGIKFEDYALHGITEYWIVNPDEKSIEQYLLKEKAYHLHQKLTESGLLKSKVVPGFTLEIAEVFG